jgi:hypothetical protein
MRPGDWCHRPAGSIMAFTGTLHEGTTGLNPERMTMSKLLRGLAAGYGAKKLGGGCISTILIFLLLWWLLGNFNIFQ